MPVRFLSDAELARLSSWPDEIADDDQLQLAGDDVPRLLSAYGGWGGRTRHDHRTLVLDRLGWRAAMAGERKQFDAFLLGRTLEHDAPGVPLQLACDSLRNERIVRPSVDTLSRRVAAARDGTRADTYHRLASLLAPPRPGWTGCWTSTTTNQRPRFRGDERESE